MNLGTLRDIFVLTLREINIVNGIITVQLKPISLEKRICYLQSLYIDNTSRSIVICFIGRAIRGIRESSFLQVRSMDSLDVIRSFSISEGLEDLNGDFSHDYSNGIFVAFDCKNVYGRTPQMKYCNIF